MVIFYFGSSTSLRDISKQDHPKIYCRTKQGENEQKSKMGFRKSPKNHSETLQFKYIFENVG